MGINSPDNLPLLKGDTCASYAPGCSADETPHICVCICTYKRPQYLRRLITKLALQETNELFTFSVVVVDTDRLRSAEPIVQELASVCQISIRYFLEPKQNIAMARNKAVSNASGHFIAFIDDDEFPENRWLLTLFQACRKHDVDGVLGPVKPYFEEGVPCWVIKGKFYDRPSHSTGSMIPWKKCRTGNLLIRRAVLAGINEPFRAQFQSGEDQDFFRRMIEKGHVFTWCEEGVVYEVVPPLRWKRSFMLKKALHRGAATPLHPTFGFSDICKSVIAVPLYTLALPFTLVLGHHRFMVLLVKLCDHLGKLLACLGIRPIKVAYVTE